VSKIFFSVPSVFSVVKLTFIFSLCNLWIKGVFLGESAFRINKGKMVIFFLVAADIDDRK